MPISKARAPFEAVRLILLINILLAPPYNRNEGDRRAAESARRRRHTLFCLHIWFDVVCL